MRSLLARMFGIERRSATGNETESSQARDLSWLGAAGRLPTISTAVSPEVAQAQLGTFAACISLISASLAGVPIEVLRRSDHDESPEPIADPVTALLNDEPNPAQTAFEVREALLRDLLLGGNAYATLEHDSRGQIVALRPCPAGWVSVEQLATGRLRYRISSPFGPSRVFLAEEVLHVRGPSRDGILGQSPITLANGSVALAVAHSVLARSQADRGFLPILSFETKETELTQEQYDLLKTSLSAALGMMPQGDFPLLLESGMKAERVSSTSQEADFLAARKLALQDVCRIYHIPPSIVGLSERAPFATAEAEARAFVNQALTPWARRLEQALARSLFTPDRRRSISIRHDLDELRLGDIKERYQAYSIGITNGILNPNEVRAVEGWGSRAGGDEYLRPLNMTPAAGSPEEGR